LVAITNRGAVLLDKITEPLRECHERQLGHLSASELKSLISLLKAAREPHEPENSPWA
jgi:hypothetical protein